MGNTTTWFYDQLNRVTQELNELGDSRFFQYDAGGHLVFKIDRNGRATQYEQDNLGRTTAENWLAGNWLTPELSVATTTQGSGTNEVQRVGFTAGTSITMGTVTLSFGGQTTGNLAYRENGATHSQ